MERRLVRMLEPWCQPLPGYFLYRPGRNQTSPALRLLIDALVDGPGRAAGPPALQAAAGGGGPG